MNELKAQELESRKYFEELENLQRIVDSLKEEKIRLEVER